MISNTEQHEEQLNIYAYTWQRLRGESLDRIAIVAAKLPGNLSPVIENNDEEEMKYIFEA